MVETVEILNDNDNQVVIFPKGIRFQCDEVEINRIGQIVILTPKNNKWAGMLQSLDMFTDDFMADGRNDVNPE